MTKKQIRLLKALGVDFSDTPVQNTDFKTPDIVKKYQQSQLLEQGGIGAGVGALTGLAANKIRRNMAYKQHVKYAKKHGLTPLSHDDYFKKNPGMSYTKAAVLGAGVGGGISMLGQHAINTDTELDWRKRI